MEDIKCQQNCNVTGCITTLTTSPSAQPFLKNNNRKHQTTTKKKKHPKNHQNHQSKATNQQVLEKSFSWMEALGENLRLTPSISLDSVNSVSYYEIGTVEIGKKWKSQQNRSC